MSKLAMITGGQQGIGLGIARALIAEGWQLALASELPPTDDTVISAMDELGSEARYYHHDLRELDAIPELLARIAAEQGQIQSLVLNAGVPVRHRGDMLDIEVENFDFVLDVNLRGSFFLAQQVASQMLTPSPRPKNDNAYQSIIFVTSVSAEMVSVERAEYCISKAAASMMARLFAARLAADDIGVFEIRPGIIETAMTAMVKEKYDTSIADGLVPAARWGVPDDIAQCVLPMVSGQMKFSTGSVVAVDGGLSIARL